MEEQEKEQETRDQYSGAFQEYTIGHTTFRLLEGTLYIPGHDHPEPGTFQKYEALHRMCIERRRIFDDDQDRYAFLEHLGLIRLRG